MYLLFVKQVFSNEIVQALCWTLVHSLWQGLLLSFVAGFIILFTKKSSPVLRYNLFCILFILFAIVTCYTFGRELNRSTTELSIESSVLPGNQLQKVDGISSTANVGDESNHQTFVEKVIVYLNAKAPFIVMFWFVIFCFNCVKISFNLRYIHRIRHRNIRSADPFWKQRIEELGDRLGIRKTILLLESGIIKVPVMVGFFKPVILVPMGLLSNLPPEQVEAILLHELAHIRRKDFFVNFIQRIVEAIFFFNPSVLWLSSLVRDERENCCDDMAIAESKSKTKFIDALVSFQEYNMRSTGYAMTFPGRKNQILNRVKRIINNDNKTLNDMEKIFLATGLIIAGFLTVAFSTSDQSYKRKYIEITAQRGVNSNFARKNSILQTDTIPKENTGIIRNGDVTKYYGRGYEIVMENNKVTQLSLNGNRIPDDKIAGYMTDIDKVIGEIIGMEEQHVMEARMQGNYSGNKGEQMEQDLEKMRRIEAEKMEFQQKEMRSMLQDQDRLKEKLRNSQGDEKIELEKRLRDMNESQMKMQLMGEASRDEERRELEHYLRSMKENQMRTLEKLGEMQGGEQREMAEKLLELKGNQAMLQEKLSSAKGKERKRLEDLINTLQIDQMKMEDHLRERNSNEKMELENKLREMNENQFMLEQKLKERQSDENKMMEQKIQEMQAQNMEMQMQKIKAMKDGEQMNREKEMLRDFIHDLISEGIITDENNLSSFALTDKDLTVNGKKQESAVHKKLKEKYIKKSGIGIFYGDVKAKGKGIYFDKKDY